MTKKSDILYSDVIRVFLDFLKECKTIYEENAQEAWKYDRRKQDYLHDLEFANNYDERNKLATRIHRERVERRKNKDNAANTEKIAKFVSDKQNKQFIERLKALLDEQLSAEEYLDGERHYRRRAGDMDDTT